MRVTKVAKAQKAQGECGKCGAKIKKGDGYIWWKSRYGPKKVRCTEPGCYPKGSEVETNEVRSAALAIAENCEDAINDADSIAGITSAMEDIGSQIDSDVLELCQEKMDNLEQGFGHTSLPAYEELEERKGEYESWKDEVESWSGDDIELSVTIGKVPDTEEFTITYEPGDGPFDAEDAKKAAIEAEVPADRLDEAVEALSEAFVDALSEAKQSAIDVASEVP